MAQFSRKILTAVLASTFTLMAVRSLLIAEEPAAAPVPASPADAQPEKVTQRIREGTPLDDALGHFKMTGDRAMFYLNDDSAKYSCLENLNLERVTNQLADNPDVLEWAVSGTLTEYRGSNYLLLTRAILKSKPINRQRLKRSPTTTKSDRKPAK
jgi:hypothetical protein